MAGGGASRRHEPDLLTRKVIGSAIEVHRELGPGLLETAYETCLCHELRSAGLAFERQVSLPIRYKGKNIGCAYRLDIVIERELVVEIKAVESLLPIHEAQIISYLRLGRFPKGLLMNFHSYRLSDSMRRFVF